MVDYFNSAVSIGAETLSAIELILIWALTIRLFNLPVWFWVIIFFVSLFVIIALLSESSRKRLYGWVYGLSLAPIFEIRIVDAVFSVVGGAFEALIGIVEIVATILEGIFGLIGLVIQIFAASLSEILENSLGKLLIMFAEIRTRRDELRSQRIMLRYKHRMDRISQRRERKEMRDRLAAAARGDESGGEIVGKPLPGDR